MRESLLARRVDAPIAEGEGADGVVVQVRQKFIEPPFLMLRPIGLALRARLPHSGCFAIILFAEHP